ncbi:hypothetical protein [Kibdelosporangium aridum]|uniref:hypothetical protein n=1 Tax=Kibdelosporangium aridum TaxID=2030 RepID=UPI000525BC8C
MTIAVRAAVVITAASLAVLGIWMWAWPDSFADYVAFPVHVHFLHDMGVFHIGLAIALFMSLAQRDSIFVLLTGFTAICLMHAGNHVMDHDLGGTASAPYVIAVQGLISGVGAWLRLRELRKVPLAQARR